MASPTSWETWSAKRRQERIDAGLRVTGPCLICDREMQYGDETQFHARYGNKWLDRHFEPEQRVMHIASLREGLFVRERTKAALYESFVCRECRAELQRVWPVARKIREEQAARDYEERKRLDDERRFQMTWRIPEPGEFERASGQLRLAVTMPARRSIAKLLFRWRVSLNQQCRGNCPAHCVALWVDKKLCAHYYGWELIGDNAFRSTDLLGPGLAVWVERTFQRELLRVQPDAVWKARGRAMGQPHNWAGTDCVHSDPWGGTDPKASLIQTWWPDGSVYVQLRNFFTLQEVEAFAWESLGVDIRKQ